MSADKTRQTPALPDLMTPWTRLQLHTSSLLAVFFLAVYARLVCPFIGERVGAGELGFNLLSVFAIQVVLRELLFHAVPRPKSDRSLARHGYRLSIVVWIVSGLLAMGLHQLRYDSFPFGSHLKLLSGYWLLGAGILAQWEYVILERSCRGCAGEPAAPTRFLERITRRVLEGNFVLTLVPAVAMLLVVWRYVAQESIDRELLNEVAYLGTFCVAMGLLMAFRFGQSLREDTSHIVAGLQTIEGGSLDVRLDTTRPDELGEVAAGVNHMVRTLRIANRQLERRLGERTALGEVALASSSVMDVDNVLDLITEKSCEVARAEASSLLLLREDTGRLHFHCARGEAASDLADASVAVGDGLAGAVAEAREPLIVPDAYEDPRFNRNYDALTGFRTRSIMTVPLLARDGSLLGVVQALNRVGGGTFSEDDLELLGAFAAQASVALENARLNDDTRRLAKDLREALEKERNLSIEKEKMQAYIPQTVVDEISRNREKKLALGGKTVEATVLFADIKGFTRLSETLDPQETIRLLNVFMTEMTDVLQREGGIVDKFIGDGIMAVFTPEGGEKPEVRAVRAGVKMQRRILELGEKWEGTQPRLADLKVRVGINTGRVVAGNIGSETRMDYTVIGDSVNVASRIEGACTPGAVWISASTYEPAKDAVVATAMPPINVKNRTQPVQCYEVGVDGIRQPA